MHLISVKDITREFKVDEGAINTCIRHGLLSVVLRRGKKRFLEKRTTAEVMKKVLVLRREGFPLRMIARVVDGQGW